MKRFRIRGAVCLAVIAGMAFALLPAVAHAKLTVARKKQIARSAYDDAERQREALNGRAESERTRAQYARVVNAYRKVYYTAPSSAHAADAVVTVGDLLAEQGRLFRDEKSSRDAIGQYEFLRSEYPGSPERIEALFSIAEIYKDDLDQPAKARATYQEFLTRYPHHRLADDCKDAIAELDHPERKKKAREVAKETPKPEEAPKRGKPTKAEVATEKKAEPALEEPGAPVIDASASSSPRGNVPLVTGVRHWSTPDYTRVAIDLQDEVKYEAGRIPSPDRIFFDLHDTKLAPELKGKSFEVGDGFLKKIRVAQYQLGLTRIVLEVDDVSDYSAFILPNPYRLIIDIHGKKPSASPKSDAARSETPSLRANNSMPAMSTPGSAKVPDKAAEVAKADLSKEPDVKNATGKPTTEPTFQTVAPRPTEPKGTIVKKSAESEGAAGEKVASAAEKAGKETSAAPSDETSTKSDSKSDGKVGASDGAPEIRGKRHKSDKNPLSANMREAKPTSNGDRSLIRALGLKIGKIVVDAGHGGHDTGTIGPTGYREKDLTLDVALRLGKLLEDKLGAEVVYTRDDDTFIPLETRTAIANREQADLFISVHANSSADPAARGVETYYLNFTSSADALEVAARENSVSEKSIHELQDLVKKIAMKEKIEESREFASMVQTSLYGGLSKNGIRNRGVKKAPFVVLIGANMPSILAEISFVSNPGDEKRLKTPDYRQRIADSLYKGVAKYIGGLSGVKLASKGSPGQGQ